MKTVPMEVEGTPKTGEVVVPERSSTWVHTAGLLLGDIVGTGVLALAGAFAALGWVPAIGLLLFFSMANLHTGLMVHRVALLHPSADSYGGLIREVFGDGRGTRGVSAFIFLFLFTLLGDYLLVLALSVQEMFYGWRLCRPAAAGIACGVLVVTNQLRTLRAVAVATIVGTVTITTTVGLSLARAGLGSEPTYDDDGDHPHDRFLVASPPWKAFTESISTIGFAYAGQTIYPEMISEMRRPQDFPKALWCSTPYLCLVYLVVGVVAYATYGESAPPYLLDVLSYNWTRRAGGALMCVHMVVSYTITQQILTRALHARLFPSTVNALRPDDADFRRGALHWFAISSTLMASAYVVAGAIPVFSQLTGLIGSVFSPFLSFIFPCVMLRRSGLELSTLDKAMSLLYVFVIGAFTFFAGTIASVVDIVRLSGETGGPFACACHAKQCVQ